MKTTANLYVYKSLDTINTFVNCHFIKMLHLLHQLYRTFTKQLPSFTQLLHPIPEIALII